MKLVFIMQEKVYQKPSGGQQVPGEMYLFMM